MTFKQRMIWTATLFVGVFAVLTFLYIWPGVCRYRYTVGDKDAFPAFSYQTDKLTHKMTRLYEEWTPPKQELAMDELANED